jgi:hypothetical protein
VNDPLSPPGTPSPNPAGGPPNDFERTTPHPIRQLFTGMAFRIRPGEGVLAWLFFLYFMLLTTCHYIGKSVRSSTWLESLGAITLPLAYLLVAVIAFPVIVLYARLTARLSQRVMIVVFCVVYSLGMVVFFWLYSFNAQWVAVPFYV